MGSYKEMIINNFKKSDKDKIYKILIDTHNFENEEIIIALELLDTYLNVPGQTDYEIFVAREDNDLDSTLGYVCIGPRPMTKGTYDLYWIAVNPNIQSKGVGSALIRHSEEHIKAKKGRLVLIETSGKPSYEKERRFYEKNSYDKITEIKDFYKKDDSLVIYGKYL
jgi:ribosomal protein S18 acetylase RimI-like enzyme